VIVSTRGLAEQHDFFNLKGFGRIESTRSRWRGNVGHSGVLFCRGCLRRRFCWRSCAPIGRPERPARQLDVSFREDAARNCKDNSPGNIASCGAAPSMSSEGTFLRDSLPIKLKRQARMTCFYEAFSMTRQRREPYAIAGRQHCIALSEEQQVEGFLRSCIDFLPSWLY
jgi:hypothetical protein